MIVQKTIDTNIYLHISSETHSRQRNEFVIQMNGKVKFVRFVPTYIKACRMEIVEWI